MPLQVTSEFGRLREVVVHRPGQELVRMTPSTRDYFLFDDLLYNEHARQEHDWLTDLLQNHLGVEVHFFERMLQEALAAAPDDQRAALLSQVCSMESGRPPVEQRVGQLEVLVRWFRGRGWPQYPHDPEADPLSSAPGAYANSLSALMQQSRDVSRDTGPLSAQEGQSFDYLQSRLDAWCGQGDFGALALELVEGIESGVAGASPSGRLGPGPGGNGQSNGKRPRPPDGDVDALRNFTEDNLFYLTPVPNLMFMRDSGTVVGNRFLLARMAAPGRVREPLLLDFVQRNHPRFKDTSRWTWADRRINDPSWPVASSPHLHLECGSVVQLREDLIVVGVSERTTMDAVQRLSDSWREHAVEQGKRLVLYVLRLPAGFNHLDSVFGVISDRECVVYSPVFEPYGPASVDVVRAELGPEPVRPARSDDFFDSLRGDGMNLTPIPCGGNDPVDQQREQWFSASNLLAVAPGKVIIYRSSEKTLCELEKRGYSLVDINDVQTGLVTLSLDDPGKWALKIKGSELSRGHGGPHSLVLPLVRDA